MEGSRVVERTENKPYMMGRWGQAIQGIVDYLSAFILRTNVLKMLRGNQKLVT